MSDPTPPSKSAKDDMIVRYDLLAMKEEVRQEFTPDAGTHRLLDQSDISKRFTRRRGTKTTAKPSES